MLWLLLCDIAQNRSEVNDGIVVFSGILEDIWENRFLVHLPSVIKVKPIDRGGETPFGKTPLGLGHPGGDIKKKRERILGGEVDDRVSNDNADKDFKMKKNEDWAKVFRVDNAIHRIKCNNNGCLMCRRWFSKKYFFNNYNYKSSHVPNDEFPEGKSKAYKTYPKKICS